jgi:hypothetical protein
MLMAIEFPIGGPNEIAACNWLPKSVPEFSGAPRVAKPYSPRRGTRPSAETDEIARSRSASGVHRPQIIDALDLHLTPPSVEIVGRKQIARSNCRPEDLLIAK